MSQTTKIAALGVLLLVVFGVAGWRIRGAMKEARGPQGRHETDEQWAKHLKEVSLDAPSPLRPSAYLPGWLPSVDGLAAIHLAKLRWRDMLKPLDHMGEKAKMVQPLMSRVMELGGNIVVKGAISDEGPELEPGQGWMDVDIYFVHSGSLPYRSLPPGAVCVVTDLLKTSEFKPGDAIISAGEFDRRLQPDPGCGHLSAAMSRFKPGEPFSVTIVRDGREQTVTKTNGDGFEIHFYSVPVLDSDLAH